MRRTPAVALASSTSRPMRGKTSPWPPVGKWFVVVVKSMKIDPQDLVVPWYRQPDKWDDLLAASERVLRILEVRDDFGRPDVVEQLRTAVKATKQ
jgi:hypothetical protein